MKFMLFHALGAFIASAAATASFAQLPRYAITEIAPPPGSNDCAAYGVNDLGAVVGICDSFGAFIWTADRGMRPIAPGAGSVGVEVYAVNNNGKVVGSLIRPRSGSEPFIWDETRGFTQLGNLGGTYGRAYAVNDADEVVGQSRTALGPDHAFFWSKRQGMIDPKPDAEYVDGRSINATGLAAGWFMNRVRLGAVMNRRGAVTKIYPRTGDCCTAANGINDRGEVVGSETTVVDGFPQSRAYRWSASGGLEILDPRTDLDTWSDAVDINEAGQVVGYWASGAVLTTFYWDASSGMHPIADLIDPADPLAPVTVILPSFVKINERGQIAASGFVNGVSRALLLTPVP